jgi:glycosyltransferase involved in cell wall biosynthesis
MSRNIGFISTRFAGTDGVTLEAGKWAQVLRDCGYQDFWFAGELDKDPAHSFLVPEAHFQDAQNQWINERIFNTQTRSGAVTEMIQALKTLLKVRLEEFIEQYRIDLLIAENSLTIPLHVPLGLALTEIIVETRIPTIAHHHDFHWERNRFSVNAAGDYLRMAFPPHLDNIEHVVINSAAQEELALRAGVSSIIIPNIVDFENPPAGDIKCQEAIRRLIGLQPQDIMILQPTRIIQRKGIEHAIELVKELDDPRCKLVISHPAGDEGFEYAEWLKGDALSHGVDLRLLGTRIADPYSETRANDQSPYSLWDIYPCADFITYPSLYEGFGNAFLEAIYFKKPMLINRYATFMRDIEPKGFDLVVMDGFLTKKNVQQVREILESSERREKMVDHNYAVAGRHYSYRILRRWLNTLLANFFGINSTERRRWSQATKKHPV